MCACVHARAIVIGSNFIRANFLPVFHCATFVVSNIAVGFVGAAACAADAKLFRVNSIAADSSPTTTKKNIHTRVCQDRFQFALQNGEMPGSSGNAC